MPMPSQASMAGPGGMAPAPQGLMGAPQAMMAPQAMGALQGPMGGGGAAQGNRTAHLSVLSGGQAPAMPGPGPGSGGQMWPQQQQFGPPGAMGHPMAGGYGGPVHPGAMMGGPSAMMSGVPGGPCYSATPTGAPQAPYMAQGSMQMPGLGGGGMAPALGAPPASGPGSAFGFISGAGPGPTVPSPMPGGSFGAAPPMQGGMDGHTVAPGVMMSGGMPPQQPATSDSAFNFVMDEMKGARN